MSEKQAISETKETNNLPREHYTQEQWKSAAEVYEEARTYGFDEEMAKAMASAHLTKPSPRRELLRDVRTGVFAGVTTVGVVTAGLMLARMFSGGSAESTESGEAQDSNPFASTEPAGRGARGMKAVNN